MNKIHKLLSIAAILLISTSTGAQTTRKGATRAGGTRTTVSATRTNRSTAGTTSNRTAGTTSNRTNRGKTAKRTNSSTVGKTSNRTTSSTTANSVNRTTVGATDVRGVGNKTTRVAAEENANSTNSPKIKGSVFGGGRMADVNNSTEAVTAIIDIYASTITGGVYGGNDITGAVKAGTTGSAKITIHDKCDASTSVGEVYGGGNGYYKYKIGDEDPIAIGDITDGNKSTDITSGTTITVLDASNNTIATFTAGDGATYGSLLPSLGSTSVVIGETSDAQNKIVLDEVYGGAKNAYVTGTSSVTVNSGTINKVFAGNNYGGSVYGTELTINDTKKPDTEPTKDNFGSFDWTGVGSTFGIAEAYGGGNAVDVQTATQVNMNGGYVGTLFGGNNLAAMSAVPSVLLKGGNIGTSYGGGNAGDMQGCEAAYLDISQYLNNDLFEANNNLPAFKAKGDNYFTTYCNTSNYLYFYGAETLILKDATKTLNIGNVYGGCRAANVDLSTYVRLADADYIGSIYGGCDMAGSVGAKPTESTGVDNTYGTPLTKAEMEIEYYDITNKDGYAKSETKLPAGFPIINLSSIVTIMGSTVSGDMFAGGNGDYQYVAEEGSDSTKVYAISDKTKSKLLTQFKTSDVKRPWTVSSIAAMEGGTLTGNLYGGGNNADVGTSDSLGRVYVLLGKTARGILSDGATGPKATGPIYAGGKKSNIYGTVDVLVKAGCDIDTLYAGNDISGQVTGSNRGNYLAGSADDLAITTVLKGKANDGNTANNTYCGWRLDKPNDDENDKAQVYVRVEGAGEDVDGTLREAAKINALFGGGNGDYDYTTATSPYYGLSKPVANSNFLDVKGIVGTCYGGGNAADVAISNTYITGDAQVTRAFGGGNSATVTEEVNLYLDCNGKRSTSADWVNGTELAKGNEPNVRFIFAGNNLADMAIVPSVTLWRGSVMTVYGGGNQGNMTGHGTLLTNQVDYMSNNTTNITQSWAAQMTSNFPNIEWKTKTDTKYTQKEIDAAKAIISNPSYTSGTYSAAEVTASKTAGDTRPAGTAIYFDLTKVITFQGTDLTIDSKYETNDDGTPNGNKCGLVVGEAYAGCRAANVDNGAYVRVSHCDYIKNIYGGCDIAGSVGAKPGTLTGNTGDTFRFAWVDPDGTNNIGEATFTDNVTDIPMWNAATWVYFTGGTCDGNIYGGGNGNYTYTDNGTNSTVTTRMGETITFDEDKVNKPWVSATTLFIEGGTINGNIYGGGNKADVGYKVTSAMVTNADAAHKDGSGYKYWDKTFAVGDTLQSSSFLCIGKGDLGRENVTIKGDVFAGGRISNILGTIDVVTLSDVKLNRLFAGNDLSGSITGNFRGTRFSTTANPITCMIGDNDNMETPTKTFNGTELTTDIANVYMRILKGGNIGTVFGGGNGDYNYSAPASGVVTITDADGNKIDDVNVGASGTADDAKPNQSDTWVDIVGHADNAYGGGNAAKIGRTNICLVGDGTVGTSTTNGNIFGGCKSANVTRVSHVHILPYTKGSGTPASTATPTVYGNVFGGCDISGNVGDCSLVCTDANAHLLADHSNSTIGHAHVDVLAGTITGRVFGGGNGLQDAAGTAYYTGTPTVSGTKPADVFTYPENSTYNDKSIAGKQLPVCQNTYVVVKNATIGTTTGSDSHTVFGGGQGAGTKVMHNVFMNLGTTSDNTTVNGVLYGGSYAGYVNSTCSDVTQTTLLGYGTNTKINGDIYGGSYGNYVRGKINLNIENVSVGTSDTEAAGIYAGNNNAAQPECEACINYVGNDCNTVLYGGGNKADFYGTTRITFTTGTVGYIYGGGNNADVYGNTIVEVLGGHVCHDVFGGGNKGAVKVNKTYNPTTPFGGNTLVIVRDDCLKLSETDVDNNGKLDDFVTISSNRQVNRAASEKANYYSTKYFGGNDPYADVLGYYIPTPNKAENPVTAEIKIDGNVYGGGNAADVEGKTTVIIGDKVQE